MHKFVFGSCHGFCQHQSQPSLSTEGTADLFVSFRSSISMSYRSHTFIFVDIIVGHLIRLLMIAALSAMPPRLSELSESDREMQSLDTLRARNEEATHSPIKQWQKGSEHDDPYQPGGHPGQRVQNLFEKVIKAEEKLPEKSN
jgi:hypothetical protein